jgi:hypothetical protein
MRWLVSGAYCWRARLVRQRQSAVLAGLCVMDSPVFVGHSSHTPMCSARPDAMAAVASPPRAGVGRVRNTRCWAARRRMMIPAAIPAILL